MTSPHVLTRSGLFILILLLAPVFSQAPAQDKTAMDKKPSLRELSTDRPDKTESPYTVDRGHFQFELDLANISLTGLRTSPMASMNLVNVNAKIGVTSFFDVQLVLEPLKLDGSSGSPFSSPIFLGTTSLRLKFNLWGNDEGPTAFGLMPFVSFPTALPAAGEWIEFGLIVPFAFPLPLDFSSGVMAQLNLGANAGKTAYRPEFVGTLTVGRDIVGPLAAYVELFTAYKFEAASLFEATFDFGFTIALPTAIPSQLDFGMNVGLTSDELNPFLGFSLKL